MQAVTFTGFAVPFFELEKFSNVTTHGSKPHPTLGIRHQTGEKNAA